MRWTLAATALLLVAWAVAKATGWEEGYTPATGLGVVPQPGARPSLPSRAEAPSAKAASNAVSVPSIERALAVSGAPATAEGPLQPTTFADGLVVFRMGGGASEFTDETRGDVFGVLSGRFSPRAPIREVSGRVVDEAGQPVGGAAVVGSGMPAILPGPVSGTGEFGGRAGALSDGDGHFAFEVPGRRLTVVALSTQHGWSEPTAVPAGDADVSGLELIVESTATVSGSVTVDGAAAQGTVSVLRRDDATKVLGRARIDDEGRYALDLPPGAYAVRAQQSVGAGWIEGETGRRRTVDLDLRAGDDVEHDFVFEAGRRVEVRSRAGGQEVGYYLLERSVDAYPALSEAISDPLETVLIAKPTPDDDERFAVFEGVEHASFTVCATVSGLAGEDGRASCKHLEVDDSQETYAVLFDPM